MSHGKYTVLYEKAGVRYKLCKVWFGGDGSYYVSSPYHPARKAVLLKMTVNYARSEMLVPTEDLIDVASAEDDELRLKLAHHPDGFVQFSGSGILSGKDEHGVIRGMGIRSWPLDAPMRGPAFGVTVRGIEQFAQAERVRDAAVVFNDVDLTLLPDADALVLEGHYLPALWRRFVRMDKNGEAVISVLHPGGGVLTLKAIFPSEGCERQGFFGLELYSLAREPDDDYASPSFLLGGPTGNVRRNLQGELIAEGIYAMFPRSTVQARRVLDYVMNEIPPNGVAKSGS